VTRFTNKSDLAEESELQAEIDLAFRFLRLAQAESELTAGGVEALKTLVSPLPPDLPCIPVRGASRYALGAIFVTGDFGPPWPYGKGLDPAMARLKRKSGWTRLFAALGQLSGILERR